ncbi:hypothetical protein BsWGS_23599 [Bradybaena similaris]
MLSSLNSSRACLMGFLAVLTLLSLAWCTGADDSEQVRNQSEYPQGIARMLFKHMRFRDLPEDSEPKEDKFEVPVFRSWSERMSDPDVNLVHPAFYRSARNPSNPQILKRQQQELLVNNLAALLADSRGKNSGSNLRMPSLRFG